jgi:hypothetical protein
MYRRNVKREDVSDSSISTCVENLKRKKIYKKSKKQKEIKNSPKRKYNKKKNDILLLMLAKSKRVEEKNILNFSNGFGLKYETVEKLMTKSGFSLKVKGSCQEFQLMTSLQKKNKIEDKFSDTFLNINLRSKNHKFL